MLAENLRKWPVVGGTLTYFEAVFIKGGLAGKRSKLAQVPLALFNG